MSAKRDPVCDPKFGDVFKWNLSGYVALYLGPEPKSTKGEWRGLCLFAPSSLAAPHLGVGSVLIKSPIRAGWRFVESIQ